MVSRPDSASTDLNGADWYQAAERRCRRRLQSFAVDAPLADGVANLVLELCIAGYRRGLVDGRRHYLELSEQGKRRADDEK